MYILVYYNDNKIYFFVCLYYLSLNVLGESRLESPVFTHATYTSHLAIFVIIKYYYH